MQNTALKHTAPTKGILVALVGCDGSGKSTLTQQLLSSLTPYGKAVRVYLGQGSGDLGRRLGKLPLIGPRFHKALLKRADANRSKDQKTPGLLSAPIALIFSLLRYRKFKRLNRLMLDNDFVLTDRYPQVEFKGQFDGPSLVTSPHDSFLVKIMCKFEESLYHKMAAQKPDIIFRLSVSPELAHSRKPDHDFDILVKKCEVASKLHYNNSNIREVDASGELKNIKKEILDEVLQFAKTREQQLCQK